MTTSPGNRNAFLLRRAFGEGKLEYIRRITVAAALLGCNLSRPLWFAPERTYPAAPVFSMINPGAQLETILSFLLIGALLGSWFKARMTIAAVVLIVILCLTDQTRFQPWLYQYFLILSAQALPLRLRGGPPGILNAYRFMFVAIYFWSGLFKINWTYAHMVFPWLAGNTIKTLLGVSGVESLAIISAIAEMLIGLGLLFPRTRTAALWSCILLHFGILLRLGPFSYGWNAVIWPWNIAMILIAILLFRRTPQVSAMEIAKPRKFFHWSIVLLCGVAPALSFVNMWDFYPSFHLYSGDHQAAQLKLSEAVLLRLPPQTHSLVRKNEKGENLLHFETWCETTMNVPPYPAERVYRTIAKSFANQFGAKEGDVTLLLEDRPNPLTGDRKVRVTEMDSAK